MTMTIMPILSGISREALKDIRSGRPTTLVLSSTQNVVALLDASAGDSVFLTERSGRDIGSGEDGLLADVEAKEITMHRHYQRSGRSREEHEIAVAQVQLVGKGRGRLCDILDDFRNMAIRGEVRTLPDEVTAF